VRFFVCVNPGVKVKTVEANPLFTNGNFCQMRSHFCVKPVFIHTEIDMSVLQAQDAGCKPERLVSPRLPALLSDLDKIFRVLFGHVVVDEKLHLPVRVSVSFRRPVCLGHFLISDSFSTAV